MAYPNGRLFLNVQMPRFNKNIKIFFNYIFGPALFTWLAISIYHQVKNQPNLELSWKKIKDAVRGEQWWMFWVVFLLMFVNWGVEARKWQLLLKPVERMSWSKAFKAILTGVAFAINTPNRIGEYGGRILYVSSGNRIKALSLTVVGSMSQFLVTLFSGCGGLLFLLNMPPSATSIAKGQSYLFWIEVMLYLVIAVCFVGLLIYFRLSWIVKLIEKVPVFSKFALHIAVLGDLNRVILIRVLSLSVTRYLVFVIQFVVMIKLMQVEVTVWQAFWLVSVVFLVLAFVPTIALVEIGLRGKVSLELFGLLSANNVGIIAATIGIWSINLVVPALLGSLLILGLKIFRNK